MAFGPNPPPTSGATTRTLPWGRWNIAARPLRIGMGACFFFHATAATEIYTLSLHDALPISRRPAGRAVPGAARDRGEHALHRGHRRGDRQPQRQQGRVRARRPGALLLEVRHSLREVERSEEHTSELQSLTNLVCRLLLEKKK